MPNKRFASPGEGSDRPAWAESAAPGYNGEVAANLELVDPNIPPSGRLPVPRFGHIVSLGSGSGYDFADGALFEDPEVSTWFNHGDFAYDADGMIHVAHSNNPYINGVE